MCPSPYCRRSINARNWPITLPKQGKNAYAYSRRLDRPGAGERNSWYLDIAGWSCHSSSSRARPKRCFAGFRASFCFSFGQSVAGKQAEQNEKQNEARNPANQRLGRALSDIWPARPRGAGRRRHERGEGPPARCRRGWAAPPAPPAPPAAAPAPPHPAGPLPAPPDYPVSSSYLTLPNRWRDNSLLD